MTTSATLWLIKHCFTFDPPTQMQSLKIQVWSMFEGYRGQIHAILYGLFNSYFSGLWSLMAVAVFVQEYDPQSLCYVHATFEGLCYCNLRLPCLVSNSNMHLLIDIHHCV